jgi:DNA-binding transcriptional ArsR family regulator
MAPDYQLPETLALDEPSQYQALFEDTRLQICDLLLERAATIKELAEALDKPKGTIGHHVGVLEQAGLIRLVRTKKVRAIEAKYYGRTARTFLLGETKGDIDLAPDHFLQTAAIEYAQSATAHPEPVESGPLSTLRYARIPKDRVQEWHDRLVELAQEFTGEPRAGDTVHGLLIAFYPTDRPHLPEIEAR